MAHSTPGRHDDAARPHDHDDGHVPRSHDHDDDYTAAMATERRRFAVDHSGSPLDHVGSYSIDPAALPGNIENFIGVAQVPIGLAGPLLVDGEHAAGEFYVPLATTEGTLVASYNRGMRLLRACGGVTTTVVDDRMQRAPAFTFTDARAARRFGEWVEQHHDEIKAVADATSRVGRLRGIAQFHVGPVRYLRFD